MAHRLPRTFWPPFILATVILLMAAQSSNAQPVVPPISPPPLPPVPKQAEPAVKESSQQVAAKELSQQEIDGLIEKAFGRNCAELKRPIRMWIADIGMVIAAEKVTIASDGRSVVFTVASGKLPNTVADLKVVHGDEIVVTAEQPVKLATDISRCRIAVVEVHDKNSLTSLTPGGDSGGESARSVEVRHEGTNSRSIPRQSSPTYCRCHRRRR